MIFEKYLKLFLELFFAFMKTELKYVLQYSNIILFIIFHMKINFKFLIVECILSVDVKKNIQVFQKRLIICVFTQSTFKCIPNTLLLSNTARKSVNKIKIHIFEMPINSFFRLEIT